MTGGVKVEIKKGDKFGKLTVLKVLKDGFYPSGKAFGRIKCQCSCEQKTIRVVNKEHLIRNIGPTQSCGCLSRQNTAKRLTTHGLSRDPLYLVWFHMIERCYNKKDIAYKNYGGRGIKVCKDWRGLPEGMIKFVEWGYGVGYTKGLEIDRIENNKGYSSNNCRFVTDKVNSSNRRSTITIEHEGIKYTFKDFWEKFGEVTYTTALVKYHAGASALDAIKKVYKTKNKRRSANA